MTDAVRVEPDNATVVMVNGASVYIASTGGISEAGTWISSQLREMIALWRVHRRVSYLGASRLGHRAPDRARPD